MNVIGQCSICGGKVVSFTVWFGVIPPQPYCMQCGARAKSNIPVIDMEPQEWQPTPKKYDFYYSIDTTKNWPTTKITWH